MNLMSSLPPGAILIVGALLAPLLRGGWRASYLVALPVFGLFRLFFLTDEGVDVPFFDQTLTLVRVLGEEDLSRFFGILFHLAAIVGSLYAWHVRNPLEQVSSMLYAGSALVVVYAGDLITLFVGWELLALTSVAFIWARKTKRAQSAGMRYLLLQLTSGLLLLAGIAARVHQGDGIAFDTIAGPDMELGIAEWCLLLGFGMKAGFPLLHTWLTDAYPEATVTGTVFLSGFTTKVAIYALARGFAGTEELIWIGVAMAIFPIFYAVIENDLRRVLSYSMINQLGFMVVGIGVGTELAVNGAVLHAFNDVFFKGLLFMSVGAVLHRTGTAKGSELGGLHKSMPWTTSLCLVGAGSISAIPLLSGFVSKTMIVLAVAEQSDPLFTAVWFVLLFASAGVVEHAGIKIPFFAFFAHDSGKRVEEAPLNMRLAMGLAAAVCIVNGAFPGLVFSILPFTVEGFGPYGVYSPYKVITQIQLLLFATLSVFVLMQRGLYPPEIPSVNIDFDWWYRKGSAPIRWLVAVPLARLAGAFRDLATSGLPEATVKAASRQIRVPNGLQLEVSVLMVIVMLLSYLLYNFFL